MIKLGRLKLRYLRVIKEAIGTQSRVPGTFDDRRRVEPRRALWVYTIAVIDVAAVEEEAQLLA